MIAILLTAVPAFAEDLVFTNLQGGAINGIHMASDGLTGWSVEDGGRIRHTTDGFTTWTFQATPDAVRSVLIDVFFLDDELTGWAVGDDHTVLSTLDGGNLWSAVPQSSLPAWPDQPVDKSLWSVHFVSVQGASGPELHGWIAGREGVLWHSEDGGTTWTSEHDEATSLPWHGFNSEDRYGLWFIDDGAGTIHGYVTGDWGLIMHAEFSASIDTDEDYWDGKPYWNVLSVPGEGHFYAPTSEALPNIEIYDVQVHGNGNGFACGGVGADLGRAYRISNWTTVTWEQLGSGNPAPEPPPATWVSNQLTSATTLYGLGINAAGKCTAVGYGSHTWESPSGGSLWQSTYEPLPAADPVSPAYFGMSLAGSRAYAGGGFGALRAANTLDPVPDWKVISGDETTRFTAGDFIDASTGWFTGQLGKVFKTTDGGVNLTEVFSPAIPLSFFMNGLSFSTADRGIVVGDPTLQGDVPFIAYTHDGGDVGEWFEVPSTNLPDFPMAPRLKDVHFVDANTAWAAGTLGKVLLTADGGVSWLDVDPNDKLGITFLNGVSFLTPTIGLVVGDDGAAFATLGGDWFPVPVTLNGGSRYLGDLMAVATRFPDTVVAVGEGGVVFSYPSPSGGLEEVYRESNGYELSAVALHPGGRDIYASSEEGTFVWFDGSTWREPKSYTSVPAPDIAAVGDAGFLIGRGFLINRFDRVP